jgi:hypothetical protein
MFKLAMRTILSTVLLLFLPAAADRVLAADPEQTAPQGEDPPGADNGGADVPPPSEREGVIPPPAIGDEDIQTDVPNPNAGHDEEVIPPSELPEQDSNPASR